MQIQSWIWTKFKILNTASIENMGFKNNKFLRSFFLFYVKKLRVRSEGKLGGGGRY